METLLGNFCLGALARVFRLGTFAWELSLNDFRMEIEFGNFRLGTFVCFGVELRLATLAPKSEACGTGLLRLGESRGRIWRNLPS